MDEFCTKAISEFDSYNRFQVIAMKSSPEIGLKLLQKLDFCE